MSIKTVLLKLILGEENYRRLVKIGIIQDANVNMTWSRRAGVSHYGLAPGMAATGFMGSGLFNSLFVHDDMVSYINNQPVNSDNAPLFDTVENIGLQFNPANGLPMLGGHGMFDVAGNVYGSNDMSSIGDDGFGI